MTKSLLSAACACALLASFPAEAAQTVRLAHTAAVSHVHHEAAVQFTKAVEARTNGEYKVEVYPAGELGDQPALAEQITLGALDMSIVSLGNMAMYAKELNAMTAPFLFSDYDQAHKVIDGFVMDWMNAKLEANDAVGLSMFDYGFRQTTTKGIVVNSADDLKGVKIRVPPSTGLLAAFDAIGANTQRIAYSELYTSLKQGVVAGEENPVFTILADSLFETQDQLALTNHYFDCQVFLANKMFIPRDLQGRGREGPELDARKDLPRRSAGDRGAQSQGDERHHPGPRVLRLEDEARLREGEPALRQGRDGRALGRDREDEVRRARRQNTTRSRAGVGPPAPSARLRR